MSGSGVRTPAGSAAFFDRTAEGYDSAYDALTPGGHALRSRRRRVVELVARGQPRTRVLDVGCGPGPLAPDLLELGFEFWGVDAAPAMIRRCRERYENAGRTHFALADGVRLPFRGEFFDAVVCTGVIDRLPEPEAAIREMLRVLRNGGALLVSFPNLLSPYAAWKRFVFYPALLPLRSAYGGLTGRELPPSMSPSSARLHTERGAARLMRSCGGEVTDVAYYHFDVLLSPLDEFFPRLALGLTRRLEGLRSGWLRWLGAGFVLKARKRA